MTIGITGVTGRLGGRVAAAFPDAIRLARDPAKAPGARRSSYDDPGDLTGITTLFMVSAGEDVDRVGQHRRFVDAAAAAGVQHVLYTSFVNAAPDATFTLARDHWATEEHIRVSGMRWTFLRDQMYADFFPLLAGEDGVIRGPADDGRVAAVAIADVADSAIVVLREPSAHGGATYSLTGPEALTLTEVAKILTAHGRPTTFYDETLEEAYASRQRYGEPDWQVEAWVSTYLAIADGSLAGVTEDVRVLSGHEPLSLAQLLEGEGTLPGG
jgi:NAD(P)H dehydrogenase (quinone)